LNQETKEFLLKEYDQVWAFAREIHDTRSKAIALYLAFLGAVSGTAVTLAPKATSDATRFASVPLGPLLDLPNYFVLVASFFMLLVTATLLIFLTRWRLLTVELYNALNGVRAAFRVAEPAVLDVYLVLPTTRLEASGIRLDFWIFMTINLIGTLLTAFAVAHIVNWPLMASLVTEKALPLAIISLTWLVGWTVQYSKACFEADDELASRVHF